MPTRTSPSLSCEAIENRIAEIIPHITRLIAEAKEGEDAGCHEVAGRLAGAARAEEQEARLHHLINRFARLQSVKSGSQRDTSDPLDTAAAAAERQCVEEDGHSCGATPLGKDGERQTTRESEEEEASPAPRPPPSAQDLPVVKSIGDDDAPDPVKRRSFTLREGRRLLPTLSPSFSLSMEQHLQQRHRQRSSGGGGDDDSSSGAQHHDASLAGLAHKSAASTADQGGAAAMADHADEVHPPPASPCSSSPSQSPVTVSPLTSMAAMGGGHHRNRHPPTTTSSGGSGGGGLSSYKRVIVSVPSFTSLDEASATAAGGGPSGNRKVESEISPLTVGLAERSPASPLSALPTATVAAAAALPPPPLASSLGDNEEEAAMAGTPSSAPSRPRRQRTPADGTALLHRPGSTHKPRVASLERAVATTGGGLDGQQEDSPLLPSSSPAASLAASANKHHDKPSPKMRTAKGGVNSFHPASAKGGHRGGSSAGTLPVSTVVSAMPSRQTSLASLSTTAFPHSSSQTSLSRSAPASGVGDHGTAMGSGSARRRSGGNSSSNSRTGGGGGDEEGELRLLKQLVAVRRQSPWLRSHAFAPPELALVNASSTTALPPPPTAQTVSRVRVGVTTALVAPRAKGFFAKEARLREQQQYLCKNCLDTLQPQCATRRRGGLPSWDSAQYCYYTGYYYCVRCHREERIPIPAHLLRSWDATPRPVCALAANFLTVHYLAPLWCVGAVAPWLLQHVPSLRAAHALRTQLATMRDVGIACPTFRKIFYGETLGKAGRNPGHRASAPTNPRGTAAAAAATVDLSSPNSDSGKHEAAAAQSVWGVISSLSNSPTNNPNNSGAADELSEKEEVLPGRRAINAHTENGPEAAAAATANPSARSRACCFIPASLRYYVEDTELWSLGDLMDLHECCPCPPGLPQQQEDEEGSGAEEAEMEARASSLSRASATDSTRPTVLPAVAEPNGLADAAGHPFTGQEELPAVAAAGLARSTLLRTLHFLRSHMAAHLLSCRRCRRRSTDVCRLCCPADVAEAFTVALLAEEEGEEGGREEREEEEEGDTTSDKKKSSTSNADTTDPPSAAEKTRDHGSFLDSIPLAAHRCLVHSFDLLHVHQCQRCGSCYHRSCIRDVASVYTQQVCGVCSTLQRAAAIAAAATAQEEASASGELHRDGSNSLAT